MVEYPDSGAVVLQTYLDPRECTSMSPGRDISSSGGTRNHRLRDQGGEAIPAALDDEDDVDISRADDAAPVLVGVVVAGSSEEAREARRAAARLERVAREFQKEWTAQSTDRGVTAND